MTLRRESYEEVKNKIRKKAKESIEKLFLFMIERNGWKNKKQEMMKILDQKRQKIRHRK